MTVDFFSFQNSRFGAAPDARALPESERPSALNSEYPVHFRSTLGIRSKICLALCTLGVLTMVAGVIFSAALANPLFLTASLIGSVVLVYACIILRSAFFATDDYEITRPSDFFLAFIRKKGRFFGPFCELSCKRFLKQNFHQQTIAEGSKFFLQRERSQTSLEVTTLSFSSLQKRPVLLLGALCKSFPFFELREAFGQKAAQLFPYVSKGSTFGEKPFSVFQGGSEELLEAVGVKDLLIGHFPQGPVENFEDLQISFPSFLKIFQGLLREGVLRGISSGEKNVSLFLDFPLELPCKEISGESVEWMVRLAFLHAVRELDAWALKEGLWGEESLCSISISCNNSFFPLSTLEGDDSES